MKMTDKQLFAAKVAELLISLAHSSKGANSCCKPK